MDEEYISIQNGDHFTVEKNDDGAPVIKIQNTVWVEDPRWIYVAVTGEHDRRQAIDEFMRRSSSCAMQCRVESRTKAIPHAQHAPGRTLSRRWCCCARQ